MHKILEAEIARKEVASCQLSYCLPVCTCWLVMFDYAGAL